MSYWSWKYLWTNFGWSSAYRRMPVHVKNKDNEKRNWVQCEDFRADGCKQNLPQVKSWAEHNSFLCFDIYLNLAHEKTYQSWSQSHKLLFITSICVRFKKETSSPQKGLHLQLQTHWQYRGLSNKYRQLTAYISATAVCTDTSPTVANTHWRGAPLLQLFV